MTRFARRPDSQTSAAAAGSHRWLRPSGRFGLLMTLLALGSNVAVAQQSPSRVETITPIRNETFNKNGKTKSGFKITCSCVQSFWSKNTGTCCGSNFRSRSNGRSYFRELNCHVKKS